MVAQVHDSTTASSALITTEVVEGGTVSTTASTTETATTSTLNRGHREGGPTGFSKKSKTPFFLEILKNPFKRLLQ